ncbi:MAG: MerR family transcriptional regulator, partial [Nocardia sp.]|nr:MerR family transcriptional regulator [Nocardia sp.]
VFTADALARLSSIRRLRAVGLGLTAIAGMLADENAVDAAVAAERATVAAELRALSWRHAVLCALGEAPPGERATALRRLAGVAEPGAARDQLIAFWRNILAAMPPWLFDDFVAMDIPSIPVAPTPAYVLAIAELAELARTPDLSRAIGRQLWLSDGRPVRDRRALVTEVAAAHTLAAQRVHAGDDPAPGPELDLFVRAHALARGDRDTAAFRRRLARAAAGHPAITRYWALTADALGSPHTTGSTQNWLNTALVLSIAPISG